MKKIAVVVTEFIAGGVEKALLELIDAIDQNEYEITAFLPNKNGQWTHLLEKKVDVVVLEEKSVGSCVRELSKKRNLFDLFSFFYFRLKSKLTIGKNYAKGLEYRLKSEPKHHKNFDIAIAYKMSNIDVVLNCLYHIKSHKKVAWVHQIFNISEVKYTNFYNQFDKVFCVSEMLKNQTDTMFPELKDKTEVFHNILNVSKLKKLSTTFTPTLKKDNSQFAIVTVGRLSNEKGQDIIPLVASLLRNKGYNFVWHLIGGGPLEQTIREKIEQYKVEENVVLCGVKDTPYPYIKNCDIYVQTSKTEGWGITVSEAKALHKPVVTTDAGVMSEQIKNGVNGIIADNYSAEALCSGIELLMTNDSLRKEIIRYLENEDNRSKDKVFLSRLYNLIEK